MQKGIIKGEREEAVKADGICCQNELFFYFLSPLQKSGKIEPKFIDFRFEKSIFGLNKNIMKCVKAQIKPGMCAKCLKLQYRNQENVKTS